ncbi:MAG: hypothetical protein V4615_14170 [Bacteroidota bacterium]
MELPRCSRNYRKFGILPLETFATGVKTGIYSNDPPFTAPPLTEAAFDLLIQTYSTRYDEYKSGGPLLKPVFNVAKTALVGGLNSLANFIDDLPALIDDTIMLGGFTPVKTTDTEAQIPTQPVLTSLKRGESNQIVAECNLIDGAEYYGCLIMVSGPANQVEMSNGKLLLPGNMNTDIALDVTKSRRKVFNSLQPGVTYMFWFYAGNAAGVSNLSIPMALMAAQ